VRNANFGQKMIDCLELAFLATHGSPVVGAHRLFYEEICARWSRKGVDRKLDELAHRGYITDGEHILTKKGREALDAARAMLPTTNQGA
jgi:hypothetical protein